MAENPYGSFLYPPSSFSTAAELIEFYESAAISDTVLSNADYAFRRWRKRSILAEIHAADLAFTNDPNGIAARTAAQFGTPGLNDLLAKERPKWRAAAEARYPLQEIGKSHMRSIVRADRIAGLRGMLPSHEQQAALDHKMTFRGQVLTVNDIAVSYRTEDWLPDALTESDYAQSMAIRDLSSLLASQQGIEDYDEWVV